MKCKQSAVVPNERKRSSHDQSERSVDDGDPRKVVMQRHDELVLAIHNHRWIETHQQDMSAFSEQLTKQATQHLQERFCEKLLDKLDF